MFHVTNQRVVTQAIYINRAKQAQFLFVVNFLMLLETVVMERNSAIAWSNFFRSIDALGKRIQSRRNEEEGANTTRCKCLPGESVSTRCCRTLWRKEKTISRKPLCHQNPYQVSQKIKMVYVTCCIICLLASVWTGDF